jgi:hypothetical protein
MVFWVAVAGLLVWVSFEFLLRATGILLDFVSSALGADRRQID